MTHPCDFGMCNGSDCQDCLSEPTVGIVPESIILPQEREAYLRGAAQFQREQQKKNLSNI